MEITNIKKVAKNLGWGEKRNTRIYVCPEGETIWQNLQERKQRPYTTYKKILKTAYKELGIPEGAKLAWNQRAGCSCPCSPGFFIKIVKPDYTYLAEILDENGKSCDIFVTIKA
jgi:hypothetical protein